MTASTFLFIYGTLMRTCKSELGRLQRTRLAAESIYIGPANINGWLYDLGSYPALKIDDEMQAHNERNPHVSRPGGKIGRQPVSGHIVKLLSAEKSFPWLDAYEGTDPAREAGNLSGYRRTTAQVQLDIGQTQTASLYVVCGGLARGRLIPDGRWIANVARTPATVSRSKHTAQSNKQSQFPKQRSTMSTHGIQVRFHG